jgi:hypothetical protein
MHVLLNSKGFVEALLQDVQFVVITEQVLQGN